MKGGLSRRQALQLVGTVTGALYGTTTYAQGRRVINLVLDDVETITIRYRGKAVTVPPGVVIEALGGKE